tara:strand:- start:378 stop:2111 length:1734 start_codon:yes stop_codon:yes gene_type:complete
MNNLNLLIKFLPNKLKIKSYLVFVSILLNTFLEILGIGTISIFLNFFINPEIITTKYPFFKYFQLETLNKNNLIIYGMTFISILFAVKMLMQIYFIYVERSFFNEITVLVQKKIYESYLLRNFFEVAKFDSSHIIRVFTSEAEHFRGYLRHFFLFTKELIIVFFILLILLKINWQVTSILLAVILIFITSFYFTFQKRLTKKGSLLLEKNKNIITFLKYSFELIKEVKVTAKEKFLQNNFYNTIHEREKMKLYHHVISSLPRLLMEFFIIFIILLISLYFINVLGDISNLIIYLSFLTVASVRLIPSLSVFGNCFTVFKFYKKSYHVICNELRKYELIKKKIYKKKIEINNMNEISLKNVNFSYSKKSQLILKNVNINIKRGDKIAICGTSGSGKTTLTNIICGLLKPSSGTIVIDEKNYEKKDYIFKKIIGFVPQENYLIDDNIKNNIIFFKKNKTFSKKKFDDILKLSNSKEFINKLPKGIYTQVGERGLRFSGGQRQRISLARALYDDPQILILDEPTSFQDKKNNDTIIKNITNLKNLTLIFISHSSYNPLLFNKIYEIKNKTISLKNNKKSQ